MIAILLEDNADENLYGVDEAFEFHSFHKSPLDGIIKFIGPLTEYPVSS